MTSAAAIPKSDTGRQSAYRWFVDFLLTELEPFPGRGFTVARMTLTATLVMLWIMVFRIPGAALGAYYTLLFSRDNTAATLTSCVRAVCAVGISLVYVIVTVRLFTGDPFLHFLWVAGTLFLIFFLLSSLTEYLAGTAFGFLAVTSITGWDFPANTDLLYANTLWTALAVVVSALVTTAVEIVARSVHPYDELTDRLLARLWVMEHVLRCLVRSRSIGEDLDRRLSQYAMVGTGALRQIILRSRESTDYKAQMSGAVAMVGRLVDLTASICSPKIALRDEERAILEQAADQLEQIRSLLAQRNLRAIAQLPSQLEFGDSRSVVVDIATTVSRIPQVFAGLRSLPEYQPSDIDAGQRRPLFKPDAFSNPAHVQFALKGTLAALSCYVIYSAIQWRGLSNSVSTCMITALTTVGSSRQKQMLRVAGAILGGAVFGMLSQVFLLPHMDGIAEFTLLFVAVTAASAWITTSSPRISYAGAQTAFAFYVTHLRTFGPQTSLAVARDDVFGILFGLGAMWMTFDRIWVKDTRADLLDLFVENLRRVAAFDKHAAGSSLRRAIDKVRSERAVINANFDQIRNLSDSLIFEFGANWAAKRKLRDQVRRWQPLLRTYFLLQVALLHYRLDAEQGQLDQAVEDRVSESQRVLALLADLNDRSKPESASGAEQRADALISQYADRSESSARDDGPAKEQPARLAESMLDVAVSIAQEMRQAA